MQFSISESVRKQQRENLAKRSASGLEKKYSDANRNQMQEAEATLAPPVITEPKCHVCTSERRLWIERQLLKGRSYKAIADSMPPERLPGGEERVIDRRSVANHYKAHMDIDSAVMRAVMEEEASLLGQSWEEGVRGAFTNRGALNILIRKGFEDAVNSVTTVEPRDLIQMIRVYNDMSESASTVAVEEAQMSVRIFIEALSNVVTDMLEVDQAEEFKKQFVTETRRLRERDAIEVEVERALPRGA